MQRNVICMEEETEKQQNTEKVQIKNKIIKNMLEKQWKIVSLLHQP